MLVRFDGDKKIAYITPEGDLVGDEANAFRQTLREHMPLVMVTLVLDLARVQSIDTTALSSIASACNWINKNGNRLIIENASRDLKKLFRFAMKNDERLTISRTGWPD